MNDGTPRKPGILFVARFFAALIVFYLVIVWNPVNDRVIVPFTLLIVRATAVGLRAIHEPIAIAGSVISTSHFALDVRNGCNAVEAMLLLASAMIAFPATMRSRLTGLLVASVAVQILNLIRVGSLVWLGEHHREAFEIVHVAVWQTLLIVAALAMFLFWSLKFAERPLQTGR